jgi:hypothetical protein
MRFLPLDAIDDDIAVDCVVNGFNLGPCTLFCYQLLSKSLLDDALTPRFPEPFTENSWFVLH